MWCSSHCLSISLLLLNFVVVRSSVFYTDEEHQQTRPLPLNRKKMAQLQSQILSVLGLQKPEPGLELTNKLASHYMTSLYKQINELDQQHNFNPTFEFVGQNYDQQLEFDFQKIEEDSHTSDTIISFTPTNIIRSQDPDLPGVYELFFNLTTNHFHGLELIVEENWDEEEEDSEASSHEGSPAFSIHKASSSSTSKPKNVFSPLRSFTGKRCKLRSLYVDFKDLGWDSWVIAPTGYQADYCDGDCSFPLDSSVTPSNHAIVQTLVHVLDDRRALPARCAPIALKSQSILFFNNQQSVVMRRYQNMRVKQCGCR